jgi:hypothetical protein
MKDKKKYTKEYNKIYNKRPETIAKRKEYREKNKHEIQEYCKQYYIKNKEKCLSRTQQYEEKHPERRKEYNKKYWGEKKEKIYQYKKSRRDSDLNYRLRERFRSRLWSALKMKKVNKVDSISDMIGCDYDFLREYISKKFEDGMTWDNYGKWHIDHIIPCAKFDLTDIKEQNKCFHYTNLQPLWEKDNKSKGHWR